jgi:cytoskeletal protein CcmA (bactofilin family)
MFKIKDSLVQQIRKVDSDTISSIVDRNMTITGALHFQGKARIDGTINGNIDGEYLILGRSGRINGDIKVATFVCHGTMEGNVTADTLRAGKSSSILGKVSAAHLVVEPGAILDSEVKTSSELFPERIISASYRQARG